MEFTAVTVPAGPWIGLLPLAVLVAAALAALLLDAFVPAARRSGLTLAALALAVALGTTLVLLGSEPLSPFPGMYAADAFGYFLDVVVYLAALGALGLSVAWHDALRRAEYPALLLLAVAGMVTLTHAVNLVTVFLGLELLSVALYALTGFLAERERSVEAALKYFFLGAFSSAFLLYGMALVFGTTGSLEVGRIGAQVAATLATEGAVSPLLLVGAALLLVGFGFKVSGVPFHMWTPDVYEGAPTPIAAFMSVATKAAAFAALIRVFTAGLGAVSADWRPWVAGIAIATMLVGNLVALTQRSLKRLLAYSSIAHAGYALIGVVAWERSGREAVLFYLLAYAFMNLGAFGVVAGLERGGEGLWSHQLAGLSRRRPLVAAAMALFLLSLAGVPPTAGFLGKFNLFVAAVEAGWIGLAVLAVLYSAVAAYYYLRIIVVMYMQAVPDPVAADQVLPAVGRGTALVLAVAAIGVVVLGVAPGGVLSLLERAVSGLG